MPQKRGRKPGKKGENASRSAAAKRSSSGGPSGGGGGGIRGGGGHQQMHTPFEALLTAAAPRPTRAAALEAKMMGSAAAEEALGCTGRIVPLQASVARLQVMHAGFLVQTWDAQTSLSGHRC